MAFPSNLVSSGCPSNRHRARAASSLALVRGQGSSRQTSLVSHRILPVDVEHNHPIAVAAIVGPMFDPLAVEGTVRLSWIARGAASAERARRQMELRGCTPNGYPLWARWEVDPLVEMHPAYPAIFALVPRRSHAAVYSKAGRLGITKPNVPWSDNEFLRLRMYRTGTREEILAAFPGRTWEAIARAARKRGHRRPKAPIQPSGIPLIDQILERAVKKNMSLADLDYFARKKGYFSKRRWRHRLDNSANLRAIRALGGQLRARFPSEGSHGRKAL